MAGRGPDGRSQACPLEERVARAVAVVATLWFTLAAAWEMFGPPLAGHYASSASVGIIADNMLRWGIAGPVWEYTAKAPTPSMYYCHHPWGIFWATAGLMRLLGRHDYVLRLAPVLFSAATPVLLYQLGKHIWRPAAGAAAAAAFVVLPISLAFASFNALEVPVIACSLLALLGYVRLTQTWKKRWIAISLIGMLGALHADWPALVLAAELLAFGLLRGFLLPRRTFGRVEPRRYGQWWALTAALAAMTPALYLALFQKAGKLTDLLASYGMRSAGGEQSLSAVLAGRMYWNELMFTPVAIGLGKVMAVVLVVRLLVLRREHEAVPLMVLGMATVQYVVFKQGADIHIFWPHYFAAYFALAMGAFVATLADVAERLSVRAAATAEGLSANKAPTGIERRPGRWFDGVLGTRSAGLLALSASALPLLAILRDGLPALDYARETGGRFNEKGLIIQSDGAKTAFLQWIEPGLAQDRIVDMHESMQTTWSQVWTLGGRVVSANRAVPKGPPRDGRDTYLADMRFATDATLADLASQFHVTAAGPFWKVDRREPAAPIDGHAIVEREPSLLGWYFVSGTEPERAIEPDPFVTWELRVHFGQPAEPPTMEPQTFDQRRIAYNIAVAAGDVARADALMEGIRGDLTTLLDATFDDRTTLVGAAYHEGACDLLTLVVRASGPLPKDVSLDVRSKVESRVAWSLTMADPTEREVGLPLAIAPVRWKEGFLYADPVPIRKRPGREVFRAKLAGKVKGSGPKLVDGKADVVVLTLE